MSDEADRAAGLGRGMSDAAEPAAGLGRGISKGAAGPVGPPEGYLRAEPQRSPNLPAIDRTPKLYIGGRQARPDSGYSRAIYGANGKIVGEVGEGNRKDIRNAVEAARAALGAWSATTAYNRAQVLYYVAENLAARSAELTARLREMTAAEATHTEVEHTIERLFTFAAYADKFEGSVHVPPLRGAALAVPEPIGVVGVVCPTALPLLGFVSLVAPLISMANTVVVV